MNRVKLVSIFNSVEGEVNYRGQGTLTTFIRFAGCIPPYCTYCDTPWSQEMGSSYAIEMTVEEVLASVKKIGCRRVTITGGEPLLQMDGFLELCTELYRWNAEISVETSGLVDLPSRRLGGVYWVVDYKLSSSGRPAEQLNRLGLFARLRCCDWVKFVVCSEGDCNLAYEVVCGRGGLMELGCGARMALSPVFGKSGWGPADVVSWIQRNRLWGFSLNLQVHKFIWPATKPGEER